MIFAQSYSRQENYDHANLNARSAVGYALRMGNETLAANIRALRIHLGLKQEAFAEKVHGKQSSVSKWESGGDRPETRPLAAMAALADVTVERFMDEPWVPPSNSHPTRPKVRPEREPTRSASEGETASIIALDLSLSMGPGTPIEDFVESEPVEFDLGWLRRITTSPFHRLRLLRGIGDSMEPKFFTGDRILLDTTERSLARLDGYYWITLWGAHGLKRLRPAGRTRVTVISENPEHDPIEVDASELTIEGRAIWFGRDL